MDRHWNHLSLLAVIFLLVGSHSLAARTSPPRPAAKQEASIEDKILLYLRERFGVPAVVKMIADPLKPFDYPGFYGTAITVDDGKQKRTQNVFITKDHRYLIVGNLYMLGDDPRTEIVRHVRELFKVPETTTLAVGPFRNSPFPNLFMTTITAEDGKQKQAQDFYLTKDNRCLVLGSIFNLNVDPRRESLRVISLRNQPGQGPPDAPVTIVEYSDLQCPMCARLHEFLEKELLPKYAGKVRLVFKEFPLVAVHDWSLTAAIANQCAYELDAAAFVPFRSLVFQNQGGLNATNARDMLLSYGEQVGVDRVKLAGCLDAKASLPRVEENAQEGKRLSVQSTPTCFINGKMVVGMTSVDAYYQAVDEALRGAR